MTRREGIAIAAQKNPNQLKIAGDLDTLIQYEYENYALSCEYWNEQPKSFEDWTNETIIPINETV